MLGAHVSQDAIASCKEETLVTKSIFVALSAAFAAFAVHGGSLLANVIAPSGLAPGSQYLLIFVTAGVHDAVDTDIEIYNSFVTVEASQGLAFGMPSGATWHAVASTDDVDANVNAPSGALPVYNTAGQRVVAPGVGIYTGVLDNLVAYDQFGNVSVAAQEENVWTGSDFQGFGVADATLGADSGDSEMGRVALDSTWLQFAIVPQFGEVTFAKPLYALSTPITVPVPEPATVTLVISALLLGGWRLRAVKRSVK